MNWLETLVGLKEENPDQVRKNLVYDGTKITLLGNGRLMNCGYARRVV